MAYFTPNEIMKITVENGIKKTKMTMKQKALLGFLGGAYISIGYLAYVRVSGNLPVEWETLPHFIGASAFPVGLILLLLGGGELITGNMMAVTASWFVKKISFSSLFRNWLVITFFNLLGALFIAYVFGHLIGLTEGAYLEKTAATAQSKVEASFMHAFISGIGCNWLVGLAVWLCYGAKDFAGKVLVIWFPIMTFVLVGFQHVVANFFIIPAAVFAGEVTWPAFIQNVIPVWLGNAVGGAVLVSGIYAYSYEPSESETAAKLKGIQKMRTKP